MQHGHKGMYNIYIYIVMRQNINTGNVIRLVLETICSEYDPKWSNIAFLETIYIVDIFCIYHISFTSTNHQNKKKTRRRRRRELWNGIGNCTILSFAEYYVEFYSSDMNMVCWPKIDRTWVRFAHPKRFANILIQLRYYRCNPGLFWAGNQSQSPNPWHFCSQFIQYSHPKDSALLVTPGPVGRFRA